MSHTHNTVGNIKIAFFLNLVFTIVEIVGGIYTNSLAIISDALHDLGDCFSLGLSWYLESFSQKERDNAYSYGYGRFSLLGALINICALSIGSTIILLQSIPRLFHPQHTNAPGMVMFAIVGITVNGIAALRLKNEKSLNARTVALHLLEDVLSWLGVLVVGIALLFLDFPVLDPLLSILITAYVLYNVIRNFKKTISVLFQAIPSTIDIRKIEEKIRALDKVKSIHHTHIWSIDGLHHVLTMHIVVDDSMSKDEIVDTKCKLRVMLQSEAIEHITVEFEFEHDECTMGNK